MSQVKCKHCGEFLFDHAGCYQRALDFANLISFVKEVSDNFCFNQTDDEGLKKLVEFEQKADELLSQLGILR
jgi:hypothetical protein